MRSGQSCVPSSWLQQPCSRAWLSQGGGASEKLCFKKGQPLPVSPMGGEGGGASGPERGAPLQPVTGKMEASVEVYQGNAPVGS